MKFISLTTMIMSAASITGTAIAEQITSHSCAHAYQLERGGLTEYNNNNPFYVHVDYRWQVANMLVRGT
ncbi:hypothetical protein BDR03DRAFT_948057, partial [Suillus americanus]